MSAWPEMAVWPRIGVHREPDAMARRFRRELGLPEDRPIVMTGHQAQVWHPGILAKYLAADVFAERQGAARAWVWVDQDVNAPARVRFPVRVRDRSDEESLEVRTWLAGGNDGAGEVPTARMPAFSPSGLPSPDEGEAFAAPGVRSGLAAIREAMLRHAGAESAAAQVAGAMHGLVNPLVREPGVNVMSLRISMTSLFAEIVAKLRDDPARCVEAYRAALAAHPRERVANLGPGELPLWSIRPGMGSSRRRVTIEDLRDGNTPVEQLAPRALLMTGLLRLGACDLFIHGTGGGGGVGRHEGYDRITDQWLRDWLGVDLAPIAVVTATMHLRIGHAGPSARELRRRQWLSHRARHDPAALNDTAAAARKSELVARVRAAKRLGRAGGAVAAYRDMHRFLEEVRSRHAAMLRAIDAEAAHAAAHVRDAEIATDRTWAFPLYEPDQLDALRRSIQ